MLRHQGGSDAPVAQLGSVPTRTSPRRRKAVLSLERSVRMNFPKKSLFAAVLAAFAFGPALADGGHGHGHGGGHDGDRHGRGDDEVRIIEQPVVIAEPQHVHRACPPGLAKRHNGCVPPGHARRVVVGEALPPGAVFVVPQRVRSTLPPPPAGYRYAVVDNQVVLVSSGNLVVDIIRSLIG